MGTKMALRVDFYLLPTTTTQDMIKYACRLAEKSYLTKQQTLIWAASKEDAETINVSLWTFRDISFVPHQLYSGSENSPVLIAFENPPPVKDVLINLTYDVPPFFNHFSRVIEIVSNSTDAVENSRAKYRVYRTNDCELFSHDLKNPA